jgi:hypothetical protein
MRQPSAIVRSNIVRVRKILTKSFLEIPTTCP